MVYDLPLVEYGMYTKFGTDWSNGADLYEGQNIQIYIRIYIDKLVFIMNISKKFIPRES